jgi:hypothetical protein
VLGCEEADLVWRRGGADVFVNASTTSRQLTGNMSTSPNIVGGDNSMAAASALAPTPVATINYTTVVENAALLTENNEATGGQALDIRVNGDPVNCKTMVRVLCWKTVSSNAWLGFRFLGLGNNVYLGSRWMSLRVA